MRPCLRAMKATDAVLALFNEEDDDLDDIEDDDIESESEDDEDDLPLSVLVQKSTENSEKKPVGAKKLSADAAKTILGDKTNSLNNKKCTNVSICTTASSKESKCNSLKYNYVLKNLFSFLCKSTIDKENLNLKEDYVGATSDEEDLPSKKNPLFQEPIDLTKSPSIKLLQMNFQRERIAISSPVFALNINNNKRKRI